VPTNTPNLNIPKPNGNEFLNRTNFNQILDAIDSNVKAKLDEKDTPASVQAKINTAITTLINNSPSSLDTLKELADALGDDPNFATTILNRFTTDEQTVAVHLAEKATINKASHVKPDGVTTQVDVNGTISAIIPQQQPQVGSILYLYNNAWGGF
jgi:predicted Zn-dependent peptidase